MGLFSKILGGGESADKAEKAAIDMLKGFVNDAKKVADEAKNAVQQNSANQPAPASAPQQSQPAAYAYDEPSGFSWGSVMPDEENQFNFSGPYYKYFEKVLTEVFPQYQLDTQLINGGGRAVITLTDGGRKALVIELLPSTSNVKKLRSDCEAQGIPYIRFYHNHDGWWNTRSYVIDRVRKALG